MKRGSLSLLLALLALSIVEAQILTSRDSFPLALDGFVRVDSPDDAAYGILTGYQKGATKCHLYVYDPAQFGLHGTAEETLRTEVQTLKSVLQSPEGRAVYDRIEFKPDRALQIEARGTRLPGVLLTAIASSKGQTFTSYTLLIAVDGLRFKVRATGDDTTVEELIGFVEKLLQKVLAGKGHAGQDVRRHESRSDHATADR